MRCVRFMFNRMGRRVAEESLSANHLDDGVEVKKFRAATKDVLVAELQGNALIIS